jgi:EpsI family protein
MQQPVPAPLRALSLAALIAVALGAFWPSTAALWEFWQQQYLGQHGPLVAAISLWLIVRSRHALAGVRVHPSLWGIAGLALAGVASLIFWRAAIQELHMLLLPLIVFFAVLAAFGGGAARILAFPIAYLYFAEPPWNVLVGPLQMLTVRAVGILAPLVGMPVRIAGTVMHLPGEVTFEVTPLCSGVNFLVVGLAVAALIGELQHSPLRRRAALLASMALITIVSNWIRVLIIMAAGYASGTHQVLVTRGHVLFGWIFFALVMWGFARLVARASAAAGAPGGPAPPSELREAPLRGLLAAVALLLAMPMLARAVPAALDPRVAPLELRLPAGQAGWSGPLAATDEHWRPEFVGAHSEWHVAYDDAAGEAVELVVIGYPSQEQDRELVNEGNSLLGEGDLAAVGAAAVVRGDSPHIETVAADKDGQRFVVWYVYDIGGRRFVTPLLSQLWYGLRSLAGPPYSLVIAYRTACRPTCAAARARLASFAVSVGGHLVVREAHAGIG